MLSKDALRKEIKLSSAQKYLAQVFFSFAVFPIVLSALAGKFLLSAVYFVFSPFFIVLYFVALILQFHLPTYLDINALFFVFSGGSSNDFWFGAGAVFLVAPVWIYLGVLGLATYKSEAERTRLDTIIRFLGWFFTVVGILTVVVPFAIGWYSMWTGRVLNF